MNRLKIAVLFFCIYLFTNQLWADIPRTMYILNESAETLSALNMDDMSIRQNIVSIGQTANQIREHDDLLYIVNSGTDDIMVVDPLNDTVIKQTIALPEGSNPWAIGFTGSTKAYVTNYAANTVSVIDLESGDIIKDIKVGQSPEGILVYNNLAFVTNTGYTGWNMPYEGPSVSIIDVLTDSVTHTLDVPVNPQNLAIDPYGRIHVICTGDYATCNGAVAIIDLYTGDFWDTPAVVDTVEFGWIETDVTTFSPGDIAITNDGTGYCLAWGDDEHGHLCSYNATTGKVIHDTDDIMLTGPNTFQMLYDAQTSAIWIPYMTEWGGDGFVQQFDPATDTIAWVSDVLGNGSKAAAFVGPLLDADKGADAIASFTPGTGAGFGSNYFPENVLGQPAPNPAIDAYNPVSSPKELLSLGHGGEIVLEFTDNYIIDGNGVDFTVFENAFYNTGTTSAFIEAGIVSASMDGVTFVEFPYDTSTFAGLAGVTPTMDTMHPDDPAVSGGDSFDLEDIGLAYAKYIKIRDLGDIKSEGDWNGDFDLDAVVAVNSQAGSPTLIAENNTIPANFSLGQNYPNPFNPETVIPYSIDKAGMVKLSVYNVLGQLVSVVVNEFTQPGAYRAVWSGRDQQGRALSGGMYIYTLEYSGQKTSGKMLLLR